MKKKPADEKVNRKDSADREKRYDSNMLKRLQLEMLLSDLSTSFINLPAEQIDQEIESSLRRITEFLGFDRASLYQESKNGQFINSHIYTMPGIKPPAIVNLETRYPQILTYLKEDNKSLIINNTSTIPPEIADEIMRFKKVGIKSTIAVPLMVAGTFLGVLAAGSMQDMSIPDGLPHRLKVFGNIFANALMRKKNETSLRQAFKDIKQLKDQLEAEWTYLREEIKLDHDFNHVVGQSDALQNVLFQVQQVAATDTTVLILGETGTGKELIARALHSASSRKDRPLIKVDCASLPSNLIENELFGHEKGAFTGAAEKKIGRMELANGGTVFLDEIGELPLELQSKLLRVLQESSFERVGGTQTIKADIRVVAATNRKLKDDVRKGLFREDLWYRLNVFSITTPPLRERQEDIPLLVDWFVQQSCKKLGKKIQRISNPALKILQNYDWPGNIRELQNVITRAIITTCGNTLQVESFNEIQSLGATLSESRVTLAENEREHILKILQSANWKIQGPDGAAEILGLKPPTLRDRMKKRGIQRPV
jgi:formate hydrogenlyase transcriptional activator